ncbi:MAG: ion transporter [Candidatus Krumholzibacteria bacterium]|nr:ion transporter [Candidatus Krumholzibacteria bacterium]
MSEKWRNALYNALETPSDRPANRIIDVFLVALIASNVVVVTLHTVSSLAVGYASFFKYFEMLSVAIFTVEYVLRMWICTINDSYRHPVLGRIKYFFSPFAIIDLIAIAPFYLPMLIPVDLLFLRGLRLMRLLRLLKLGRYSEAIRMMGSILKSKKEEITIAITMSLILLLIASGLMYYIESSAQPAVFSSIPAAMWWGVMTMTTVGYGDVYPITPAGKVLAGVIALLGISLFILPAGIIAAGYAVEIQKRKNGRIVCPKCGNVIS